MFHYNKLKNAILNWDGVHFPTGNRDIDRFEENNKSVSINVFEPDDCLNDNKIILHRGTKNRNAKYEIDLLKIYDENNNHHYVLVKNKCRVWTLWVSLEAKLPLRAQTCFCARKG